MRKLAATVTRPIKLASWTPAPRRDAAQGWPDRSRYRADNLPAIRKRKGIGRPPAVTLQRQENAVMCRMCGGRYVLGSGTGYEIFAWTWDDGIRMARHHFCRKPSPNLAEWERKPRRKDRAAA